MLRINQIKIPVQEDELPALKKKIDKMLRCRQPYRFHIIRKSLDARDKMNLMHIYTVDIELDDLHSISNKIIDNKN